MRCCFLSLVDVIEFHEFETHSRLGLTAVEYIVNKLLRLEKESVIVRIKPRILTHW